MGKYLTKLLTKSKEHIRATKKCSFTEAKKIAAEEKTFCEQSCSSFQGQETFDKMTKR